MKLNRSSIRTILSVVVVVIALAMYLFGGSDTPPAADPAPPEASVGSVSAPAEEAPDAPAQEAPGESPAEENEPEPTDLDENGSYTSMQEVADYLHTYGKLPGNFITKNEARELGWQSSEGNLWEVAPGMSIGGDRFGNNEGLLPDAQGRQWYECDIDYQGGFRDARRIVFSNDGLIFYTDDHYESFTQLY